MNSKQEAILAKAEQQRDNARRLGSAIRTNAELSLEGRRTQLARLQSEHDATMAGLSSDYNDAQAQELARAQKLALGHKANDDLLQLRDAAARAALLTEPREAESLLATALRQGDESFAKEIVLRGLEMHWGELVSMYSDAHPRLTEPLQLLWDNAYEFSKPTNLSGQFAVAATLSPTQV